jgi:hypothetical protein
MARTADRLMLLVDTLVTRVANARDSGIVQPSREETIYAGAAQLEREMRDVADASGVCLGGEVDDQLNLDDLEKSTMHAMPEDEKEETYTVLEVTPKEGIDLIRKRKREE